MWYSCRRPLGATPVRELNTQATILHEMNKIVRPKIGIMLPGLMGLDFSHDIMTVGFKFD